jgi:putative (di)nucleoside polyphosphate hydrolase
VSLPDLGRLVTIVCMPKKSPTNSLRPNVCMLIYNRKGQLFLGERYGKPGHWQFPQGGVERGDSLKESVLRELKEEIGVSKKALGSITRLRARHSYLWRKIPDYARGIWVGQAQTFWLVEFTGDDSDIDLDASTDPEFSSWRWCAVTTVKRIAARERIAGYTKALREFADFKKRKLSSGVSKKTRRLVARRRLSTPYRKPGRR